MDVTLVTCLRLGQGRRAQVTEWCNQNLGGKWKMIRCLCGFGCTIPSWEVVCDQPDRPMRYRIVVTTPEDHALVRLTWC
jgi:hypothetical protein